MVKKTRRRNKGGKPVFAGAQGCVFMPSLKCKDRPHNRNDGNISKLGYKEGTETEMSEQEGIMQYIKKIRNHEMYFNTQASLCEPDALSPADLVGFNNTCKNFDKDITASNVNQNLDKLRAINMPNLGEDLKVWMEKYKMDAHRVRQLNDRISDLLVHAIVPMNQLGVMHNDLKSENLMMGKTVRVIDWGLAGIATRQHPIPEHHFMNNPVTYNRLFSTMIVSRTIDELYHKFISQLPAKFEPEQLEPFISDLYKLYQKMAPTGHEYFVYVFKTMFKLNTEMATLVLQSTLERYNARILYHFTHPTTRKFMMHDYFNKVYRFNTDVWGVMSVFYSMFMLPRDHFIMPDSIYDAMLQQYRTLFRTTVFANGHTRMNVQRIVQQLRKINKTVTVATQNKTVKKMVRFNIDATPSTGTNPRGHMYRVPTPHPIKGLY
jgi:predicted SnoaL-like aldol condensation-catalyzing enzyme